MSDNSESSSEVDVKMEDTEDNVLGFKPQKRIIYNLHLPYSNSINEEILIQLKDIKYNLAKSVLLKELCPSTTFWLAKLTRFINAYGMCFSKEDHIYFIKLVYELAVTHNQEVYLITFFFQVLNNLLSKRKLLSPDDLQLEWQPLYEMYKRITYSSYRKLGIMILSPNTDYLVKSAIRSCRSYFPPNATAEMLEEWRPKLCLYDESIVEAVNFFELFLPTCLAPNQDYLGWKLWLDEFIQLWKGFHPISCEGTLFWLFARLSWRNIGYIDWTPHMPLIYTRILRSFPLPVKYKNYNMSVGKSLDNTAICMFLISNLGGKSDTQKYLEQLFKTLESYYHPSNTGIWTRTLDDFLCNLSNYFIQRLHRERYKKPSWETNVPEEKKLTEEDITAFVKCLMPPAQLAKFSKAGCHNASTVFHNLALVRPEIVIPPLLDQLYSALDATTEPHRLIASLQSVIWITRSMVLGGKYYPEGPTHIVPLLMLTLPGIDPNDIPKCVVTLEFIATIFVLINAIDCSSAVDDCTDLTEHEQTTCLQTAGFEEYVLQFLDKVFALIESYTLSQTTQLDRETENMNREENMMEISLTLTVTNVLNSCHPKIYEAALSRIVSYTKGRFMETRVAGKFIAAICCATVRINPEVALKAFIPGINRILLSLTDNFEVLNEEQLNNELLFNLLLLSELVQCHGSYLHPYIADLKIVLDRTLHLQCKYGYKLAGTLLNNLIKSMNLTLTKEFRSNVFSWDKPFSEYLPIRHWGEAGDLNNLNMEWIEPSEAEGDVCRDLVNRYLIPELDIIKNVIKGDATVSKDRFHQSLNIVQEMLYGGAAFPFWDETPITLIDSTCERHDRVLIVQNKPIKVHLDHPDYPSNVRLAVINTILDLASNMLKKESDDTKAFNYILTILHLALFFHGVEMSSLDGLWKEFERIKLSLSDDLRKFKKHPRFLLMLRVHLQHKSRVAKGNVFPFTATHKRIVDTSFAMATSLYSEVRKKAQNLLNSIFKQYAYSYQLVVPSLLENLQKDPNLNHKEFKGSLYVLIGSKQKSLLVRNNWPVLRELWPTIISAQHSEKPSIVRLFDSCFEIICIYMEHFALSVNISDAATKVANSLIASPYPSKCNEVSDELISSCHEAALVKGNRYKDLYATLLCDLAKLIETGTLHWRRHRLATIMIGALIRPNKDVEFPAPAVRAMLQTTINDNIILRKSAIHMVVKLFKIQKREHKKRTLDPKTFKHFTEKTALEQNRRDNEWLQYDKKHANLTEELRENHIYIHKTWIGWYSWQKEVSVYCPPSEQPPLNRKVDELPDGEKEVYYFFSSQENVDKLMSFLSLEENKGADEFNQRRYWLFKGLFRNFGCTFLNKFSGHIKTLINDTQESTQRCASELVAGIIRGSKHWPYKELKEMQDLLCPLLEAVVKRLSVENACCWNNCFYNIVMDRDPNHLAPFFELLLEDPLQEGRGSCSAANHIHILLMFLSQYEWRVAEPCHRLLEYLKPYLSHSYKNIRDSIGLLLFKIFLIDNKLNHLYPNRKEFVESLLPQLSILIQDSSKSGSTTLSGPSYSTDSPVSSAPSYTSDPDSMVPLTVCSNGNLGLLTATTSETVGVDMDGQSIEDCRFKEALISSGVTTEVKTHLVTNSVSAGFVPGESEERKSALRLMNTLCQWLTRLIQSNSPATPDIYLFLPHLCQLESIDTDQELRKNCLTTLSCLSQALILPENVKTILDTIESICHTSWWRARASALSVLQVTVFNNMFIFLDDKEAPLRIKALVLELLHDTRIEVRQIASTVLSGLFHCNFIQVNESLLKEFTIKLKPLKKLKKNKSQSLSAAQMIEAHAGVLGLCAFTNAFPYEVPEQLPEVLITLSYHINDAQPVAATIKDTLSNFKRTHYDNWRDHKQKFTSAQLDVITDLLVSPSYYA